jgi:hypothetical protein
MENSSYSQSSPPWSLPSALPTTAFTTFPTASLISPSACRHGHTLPQPCPVLHPPDGNQGPLPKGLPAEPPHTPFPHSARRCSAPSPWQRHQQAPTHSAPLGPLTGGPQQGLLHARPTWPPGAPPSPPNAPHTWCLRTPVHQCSPCQLRPGCRWRCQGHQEEEERSLGERGRGSCQPLWAGLPPPKLVAGLPSLLLPPYHPRPPP